MKDFQIFKTNFNFIFNYFCGWVVVATWGITVSKLESLASRNTWSVSSLSNGGEAAEAADTENRGSCYINCSQGVPFLALVTVPFRAVANGVWSYGSLEKYRDFFFLFVVSTFYKKLIWAGVCLEVIVFCFLLTLFPPLRIQLRWQYAFLFACILAFGRSIQKAWLS